MAKKNIAKSFKFSDWKPDLSPVPAEKMPVDKLAPVPPNQRLVRIQDRNIDMINIRGKEILERIKEHDKYLKKYEKRVRNILKKYNPRPVQSTLGQVVFPITIQRDEQEDHIVDIAVEYDAWFFGMPLAGWDPIEKKFAVDEGQQRLLALRDRIRLGLHPDCKAEDWESYPIDLQVIDLQVKTDDDGAPYADYSPLRIRFIIENDRKLKVSDFDKIKNESHGKLTDSPNAETLPAYEKAADRYLRLKKKGITLVDAKLKKEADKPGAFTAVRYLRDNSLTNDDVENIASFHSKHLPGEPVADMEVLPVKWLYKIRNEHYWHDDKIPAKVKEWDKFLFCLSATALRKRDFDLWSDFSRDVWSRRMKHLKSTTKIPDEFSMVLLMQMTKEAGYMYPGIDSKWYTAYTDEVSSWDVLTKKEQEMFSNDL